MASLLTERRNICGKDSAIGHVCFDVVRYVTTATYVHVEMATGDCKTERSRLCPCGPRLPTVYSRMLVGVSTGLLCWCCPSGGDLRSTDSARTQPELGGWVDVFSRAQRYGVSASGSHASGGWDLELSLEEEGAIWRSYAVYRKRDVIDCRTWEENRG